MKRWYAVQSRPRSELEAAANLSRQGFEVYLPRHRRTRSHARRRDLVSYPLFPGYLFVRFDALRDAWRSAASTFGVSRLVGPPDAPLPIPDPVIDHIRSREDPEGFVVAATSELRPGDQVCVASGPFAEMRGIFEAKTGEERIRILLSILGGEVRVNVRLSQIAVR
jgi:transcriptional antiterminator RfaH